MSEQDTPAVTSLAYDSMLPSWRKIQTVLDGTEAMRRAGELYLPKHEKESDAAYKERLARAVLYNVTKLTLTSWVGRPFGDEIKFQDTPKQVEDLLTNVDLQGTDVHVFARDWFSDGVAKALSHVYIDFPVIQESADRTLADDRAEKIRPYWIHYRPEQLIFADATVEEGEERLQEIRLLEEVKERAGFGEVVIQQIRRVLRTMEGVKVEIWQFRKVGNKEAWLLQSTTMSSLPFIPLVTFYSHRDGLMHGTPPLEDLADLNISHWQSLSDQTACLTVARFPILAASGSMSEDEAKKLVIGPYRWLHMPDPSGKFYYVEHTGAAIAAGRTDLQDLQAQMESYGAEFLRKRPGGETATARALDSAEATSPLQDIVMRFSAALELALKYTAEWLKLEDGGTVELVTDYGPESVDQAELNTLRETRKGRDISRTAYLTELKRRGLLADDYDIEADALVLEQEALDLFGTVVPEPEPELDENGDPIVDEKMKPGEKKMDGDEKMKAE